MNATHTRARNETSHRSRIPGSHLSPFANSPQASPTIHHVSSAHIECWSARGQRMSLDMRHEPLL